MKRLFALLLILISVIFVSCNREKYHILPFEGKDVRAECVINEKFDAIIEKSGDTLSLNVISPKEIGGISFVFSDAADKMISGEMSIPISREELYGIYTLASVFELNEEAMTSAVSRDGVGELSFSENGIDYSFFFGGEGEITEIRINGKGLDYTVKISMLTVAEVD